ncbi:hypothetical protein CDD80_771 [Ophiocordyceps camponoti-rufipedis]|uniref:Uncharacterized protein n=1 Tax=Ophiocordyceps camponoti-rufipedis TaxID=2004952 RepID=A0A2C5YJ46_9HYPO|nr:hypothetical protein CDD80_771 [Ophiocordyceps camponoti-rufipedis]
MALAYLVEGSGCGKYAPSLSTPSSVAWRPAYMYYLTWPVTHRSLLDCAATCQNGVMLDPRNEAMRSDPLKIPSGSPILVAGAISLVPRSTYEPDSS